MTGLLSGFAFRISFNNDSIYQPEGRCGLAETLVESAYAIAQHLFYNRITETEITKLNV